MTEQYKRVMMVGDSMGATAALLFSPLATAVQAFSPQVDRHDALFNPKTSTSIQKHHFYTGNLNSETRGDSKSTFLQ